MITQLNNNQKGMLLSLAGYTAFAYSDCAMKWIAPHYPSLQITCIQTAIAALCLLFTARFLGGWKGAKNKKEMRFHIMRAVMNVLMSVIILYSFSIMSLASVYSMIFAKPFFAAILAVIFYKERVNIPRWAAIAMGFVGVLIIIQPTPESFEPALLIPLFGAMLVAIMFVTSRSLTEASPFVMSFYPLVGTCLFALPFALFGIPDFNLLFSGQGLEFVQSKPVEWEHIPFFIAAAVLSGTGILCVSLAFRIGNAATVAPFLYSEMIWGLLFGYLIFGDHPNVMMLIGTAVIVGSGLYLIVIERWRRPMIAAAPASAIPPPVREQKPQPWNFYHDFFHRKSIKIKETTAKLKEKNSAKRQAKENRKSV